MQFGQGGFLRLRRECLSVAELSSSLQGDPEMLLKRWLSGRREPVETKYRLESTMNRHALHRPDRPDTMT
jgi:hypothetical protein